MPFQPQLNGSSNADQRLSQIIKLKHLEKPEPAFWHAFEQEFRNRQLTSFVQVQPWHIQLKRKSSLAARKAWRPIATAATAALAVFATISVRHLVQPTADQVAPVASAIAAAEPDAFFVVQAAEQRKDTNPPVSNKTIYQVTELSSSYGKESDYQVNAMPVSLSQGPSGQTLGTKTIRTQERY